MAEKPGDLLRSLRSLFLDETTKWLDSERAKREIDAACEDLREGRGSRRWLELLQRVSGGAPPSAADATTMTVLATTLSGAGVILVMTTLGAYFCRPPRSAFELGALGAVLIAQVAFLAVLAAVILKLLDREG